MDADGYIYAVGTSTETWGGAPIRGYVYNSDAWAAKVDDYGHLAWNSFIGGDGKNYGKNIFVDEFGYITVVGYGLGTWQTPLSDIVGGYDSFLCKLGNDGIFDWLTFVGGTGDDFAEAASSGPDRGICIVAVSDADWGTPLRSFSANYDAFVAWVPETPEGAGTVETSAPAQGTVAGQVLYLRVRGRIADGSEIVSAVRWFIPRASR